MDELKIEVGKVYRSKSVGPCIVTATMVYEVSMGIGVDMDTLLNPKPGVKPRNVTEKLDGYVVVYPMAAIIKKQGFDSVGSTWPWPTRVYVEKRSLLPFQDAPWSRQRWLQSTEYEIIEEWTNGL